MYVHERDLSRNWILRRVSCSAKRLSLQVRGLEKHFGESEI